MKKAAEKFVDLVRDIVQQELDREDDLVLCEVTEKKDDIHYDVNVLLDENNVVVQNVTNVTPMDLKKGDRVYLYKIKNVLQNSFIINTIIPYVPVTAKQMMHDGYVKERIIAALMGYIREDEPTVLTHVITGGSYEDETTCILGYEEM